MLNGRREKARSAILTKVKKALISGQTEIAPRQEYAMRAGSPSRLLLAVTLATSIGASAVVPAMAENLRNDRVYADSFGNLVIESSAGFKRIVVGEGSQADKVRNYIDRDGPSVVYGDSSERLAVSSERCYRAPWLVKGRSYMYGFDQGEIPFQGGPCE